MKNYWPLLLLLISFIILNDTALAQGCSMCTKTASQLGDDAAKGLNRGILYLAALPLSLMAILFYIWKKGNIKF